MRRKSTIWKFVGPLRVVAISLAALYGVYFTLIWGLALMGSTELVFDLVDIESEAPLLWWQLLSSFIFSGVTVLAVVLIAMAVNRLLKKTYRMGFFEEGISPIFRQLGWALILFWIGLYFVDNIMPWVITLNLEDTLREELEWFPIDDGLVALLVGFVFLLVGKAMDEARKIDEDNKQII